MKGENGLRRLIAWRMSAIAIASTAKGQRRNGQSRLERHLEPERAWSLSCSHSLLSPIGHYLRLIINEHFVHIHPGQHQALGMRAFAIGPKVASGVRPFSRLTPRCRDCATSPPLPMATRHEGRGTEVGRLHSRVSASGPPHFLPPSLPDQFQQGHLSTS